MLLYRLQVINFITVMLSANQQYKGIKFVLCCCNKNIIAF